MIQSSRLVAGNLQRYDYPVKRATPDSKSGLFALNEVKGVSFAQMYEIG
jgi:hypothetical protein